MSSAFETQVRARRDHTPWARMDLAAFMREMAWNDRAADAPIYEGDPPGSTVVLKLHHRPSVASREWWELSWVGENGQRHTIESQYLQLLLWRAAEWEMANRDQAINTRQDTAETAGEARTVTGGPDDA